MKERPHSPIIFHHLHLHHRRDLLRGLGAAGLGLLLGPGCDTSKGAAAPLADRGLLGARDVGAGSADLGATAQDQGLPGADGGLPPIDLAAPKVTQTATFALG